MKAHKSALKHGISEDAAIYAAEHHVYVADLDDDFPARQFRLGFDPGGRLLELVVSLSVRSIRMPGEPNHCLRIAWRIRRWCCSAAISRRDFTSIGTSLSHHHCKEATCTTSSAAF